MARSVLRLARGAWDPTPLDLKLKVPVSWALFASGKVPLGRGVRKIQDESRHNPQMDAEIFDGPSNLGRPLSVTTPLIKS